MKCPECVKVRGRSVVTEGGGRTTLMSPNNYYDEDGIFHSHDPNITTTTYSCSNGHEWTDKSKSSCPNCNYGQP